MRQHLASQLAAAAARRDVTTFAPTLLDAQAADTAPALAELVADRTVVVVDELAEQLEQLVRGRAPGEALADARVRAAVAGVLDGREPAAFGTWAFYPWSRRLVHVLPEPLHRELRLDRNRYAITLDEQQRLTRLSVAVAGLSVGRAVVSTMAHEGIGGELRLADFDVLDLSNLNRVAGRLADVGVSKVVLAAREVAELDPYIRVVAYPGGVHETTIADFVAGADVVVDECDDLEMKVRLREHARAAGLPVVMATSHRGMLDVERFDLEPERPTFHGLLGDVTSAALGALTTKEKVPYVIRILDPASLTDRAAASMVEVKESVSTWPQLASDVALGGAMVANAVRRIALGELTASGRFYADLDALTADGRQAPLAPAPPAQPPPRRPAPARMPAAGAGSPSPEEVRFVVACASSAPSGGNMQPWRFEARSGAIRAWVDPTRSSLLDFRNRAALLALGAALEAATIGAPALGFAPVPRAVAADGPVWELALERADGRPRRAGRRGPVAALLQPAHGLLAPDRGRRARAAGAPRRAARHAGGGRRCAGGPRRRPGRPGPRALPVAPAAARPDRRAALHGARGAGLARRHRRRVTRARRRRPRRDGRPAHRRGDGPPRAAGPRPRPRQRVARRVRRDRPAPSSCARRASTAPRWSTPAADSCACGSRPRARDWRSIRGGRRSSSSACSRTATRWRGGSAAR